MVIKFIHIFLKWFEITRLSMQSAFKISHPPLFICTAQIPYKNFLSHLWLINFVHFVNTVEKLSLTVEKCRLSIYQICQGFPVIFKIGYEYTQLFKQEDVLTQLFSVASVERRNLIMKEIWTDKKMYSTIYQHLVINSMKQIFNWNILFFILICLKWKRFSSLHNSVINWKDTSLIIQKLTLT